MFTYHLRSLLVAFLCVLCYPLTAQQSNNVQLNVGLSRLMVKDLSFSPLRYTTTGLKVGVAYEWGRNAGRHNLLSFRYRGGGLTNAFNPFPIATINDAHLQYRRLWSVGNSGFSVGGSGAGFVLFKTLFGYANNGNSYDMGANLGLAVAYGPRRLGNDRWGLRIGIDLPVVAYYIRPFYSGPFPSEFVTPENYTPYIEASTVVPTLWSSGQVVSWSTYFEVQSYVQVVRTLTEMFDELRLRYHWHYRQYESLESSYTADQWFSVGLIKYVGKNCNTHEQ